MFIYLSKKISIPNDIQLKCVGWENNLNWLACGGEDALLKALKLETEFSTKQTKTSLDPPQMQSNLSLSQTLDGHSGTLLKIKWNRPFSKLTTADSNGMVIVWIQHKGLWYEEMVNDRGKCAVADLQWDRTGKKIAIAYADGNIIIGGVEGNRIQAKDLGCGLTHLAWSPDSNFLLLATSEGPLRFYDSQCNYLHRITTFAGEAAKVISMDWYNGHVTEDIPCLAIAFDNGKLQLSKNERDPGPILVDTNLRNVTIAWNPDGTILAVGGIQFSKVADSEEAKVFVLIQLYTCHGTYLRYLKVPGTKLAQITWESSGLKLTLAVDSVLYFCNLHLDHKFAYVNSTLCYLYSKEKENKDVLVFYNHQTNTKIEKLDTHVNLIFSNKQNIGLTLNKPGSTPVVSVVNTLGTPLDTRSLYWFRPTSCCMNKNHVILTDGTWIAFFPYQVTGTASALSALLWQKESQIKLFHADTETLSMLSDTQPANINSSLVDPILGLTCTEEFLVFSRASNLIAKYHFPGMTKQATFTMPVRPHRIYMNCDGETISITDLAGVLRLLNLNKMTQTLLPFERKDVWAVCWSEEDPNLMAVMEKSRMIVLKDTEPESPVLVRGYLASFSELLIHLVDMDSLMLQPEEPFPNLVIQLHTKSFREAKELIDNVSLNDAMQVIEQHPHPKLYSLLLDASLEKLDLGNAQHCMIKLRDYAGLQFLKRLSKLNEKSKQKAQILAYLGKTEEAEMTYLEMDRRDLALDMYLGLCHWFRIVQMGQAWGANDALMEQCWKSIGEEYMRQSKWNQAITFLTQARQFDSLADCYFFSGNTLALEKLCLSLPSTNPVLEKIGDHFAALGMCQEAVSAYMKRGLTQKAVDLCVHLHQWHRALELSKNTAVIDKLFNQFASKLKANGDVFLLISLYKNANLCLKAAQLLFDLGNKPPNSVSFSPLLLKKIFVLAGLEVEHHHQLFTSTPLTSGLQSEVDGGGARILEAPWRNAEAYHFYLLSQRQYHQGDVNAALRTSMVLRSFEDILTTQRVHSLIGIFSYLAGNFSLCSKSLSRLQKEAKSESECENYEQVAIDIFQ
ncbi:WD repeat-containing protein 35, partial [Coelomomyces lativittatus]